MTIINPVVQTNEKLDRLILEMQTNTSLLARLLIHFGLPEEEVYLDNTDEKGE